MVDILGSEAVHAAIEHERLKDEFSAEIAEQLMTDKTWVDMSTNERGVCVRFIVSQVESEEKLRERLTELGAKYFSIQWSLSEPGDQTGQEARMLVKALGGLVAKNGALVMIMTPDEQF